MLSSQVKGDWSTAGNNSQHTASVEDSASDGYGLQQNWNLSVTGNAYSQCAIDSQGILYAATSSYLYAVNSTTGIVIWSFAGNFRCQPVVSYNYNSAGIVYVFTSSGSGRMYGIFCTGAEKGTVEATSSWTTSTAWKYLSPTISSDGKTMYLGFDNSLSYYTIDLTSPTFADTLILAAEGAGYWSTAVVDSAKNVWVNFYDPAKGLEYLYAASATYHIQLYAKASQPLSNYAPSSGSYISSPTLSPDNSTVYVGMYDGYVYAYTTSSGTLVWKYLCPDANQIQASPIYSNGVIYVNTLFTLYALNATTGSQLWSVEDPSLQFNGLTSYFNYYNAMSNGTYLISDIYPATSHAVYIYGINGYTGTYWNYSLPSNIAGISEYNDNIFYTCSNGYVYSMHILPCSLILTPTSNTCTTGEPFTVSTGNNYARDYFAVSANDINGNPTSAYLGKIYFIFNDSQVTNPYNSDNPYTFQTSDDGTHQFPFGNQAFIFPNVETLNMTVTDGLQSSSLLLNVQPYYVSVSPQSAQINAGNAISLNLTRFGYTLPGYSITTQNITSIATWSIASGAGGSWSNNNYTSQNEGTWLVTGTDPISGESSQILLTVGSPTPKSILPNNISSTVLYDNFEDGLNYTKWDLTQNTNTVGNQSWSIGHLTTSAFESNYALNQTSYTDPEIFNGTSFTSQSMGDDPWATIANLTEVWTRSYINIVNMTTNPWNNAIRMHLMLFASNPLIDDEVMTAVTVDPSTNKYQIWYDNVQNGTAVLAQVASSVEPPLNTWFCLETHTKISTNSTNPNGFFEVYQDGTLIFSIYNLNNTQTPLAKQQGYLSNLGSYEIYVADFTGKTDGNTTRLQFLFDDVGVYSVSQISSYATSNPNPVLLNTPFELTVTALTTQGKQCTDYGGQVYFSCSDPQATLPVYTTADNPYTYTNNDSGQHTFSGFAVTQNCTITINEVATGISTSENISNEPLFSITNVLTQSSVEAGFALPVNVTLNDNYNFSENLSVQIFANSSSIFNGTINLEGFSSGVLDCSADTSSLHIGNYTITASVIPSDEPTATPITMSTSIVSVTYVGDLNGDFKIDSNDFFAFMNAYILYYSHPSVFIPLADFNHDGKIDANDFFAFMNAYIQYWIPGGH